MENAMAASETVRVHVHMLPVAALTTIPIKKFLEGLSVDDIRNNRILLRAQYYFNHKGPLRVTVAYRHIIRGLEYEESMSFARFVHVYRSVFTAEQWEIITKPVRDFIPE